MTARGKRDTGGLFAAAGLDRDAPRPLADKLRPQRLSEVVGQDHLIGPDGVLTRMLETGTCSNFRLAQFARRRRNPAIRWNFQMPCRRTIALAPLQHNCIRDRG